MTLLKGDQKDEREDGAPFHKSGRFLKIVSNNVIHSNTYTGKQKIHPALPADTEENANVGLFPLCFSYSLRCLFEKKLILFWWLLQKWGRGNLQERRNFCLVATPSPLRLAETSCMPEIQIFIIRLCESISWRMREMLGCVSNCVCVTNGNTFYSASVVY